MVGTVKTLTGITATGVAKDANGVSGFAIPEGYARTFALEVNVPSGALTSWSANLEGSIDGGQTWSVIGTHSANIGTIVWAVDKPVTMIRFNVTALVLNTAPSITLSALAVP